MAGKEAVIDNAAQWYAYRVTWYPEIQNTPGEMNKIFHQFELEVVAAVLKGRANNGPFMAAFTKQMITRTKEVLGNDHAIARLNGMRLLVRLATTGQEPLADAFVDALEDKDQNDGVKYFALQGLKELFALGQQSPPIYFKDKARETRAILALIKFIERKPTYTANVTPEEIDGFRRVRQEAIEALAQTRYPAVEVNGKVEGRTAQVLLRVVAKDDFTPDPGLHEQLEAAIGVARLKADLFKGYQPDYAAYYLGGFLVNFADRRQKKLGRDEKEPWQFFAARMSEALEAMRNDTREVKPAGVYVAEMVGRSLPLLKTIEQGQTPDPTGLSGWLRSKTPASQTVYAGLKDSAILLQPAEKPVSEAAPSKKEEAPSKKEATPPKKDK